jgi:hypothetical protein
MQINDMAGILKTSYEGAPHNEKVVAIHLFGIRHAGILEGFPLKDIAILAGISETYATEIRKGMKLAKYVILK